MTASPPPRSSASARGVAPPSVKDTARIVTWALFFYGGAQLLGSLLARASLGAVAVQAALAEWGAGRLAIAWSDPVAPAPTWRTMARRAGAGAALGFAAGAFVVVFVLVTRAATLAKTAPLLGQLAIGLLMAALTAMRDELLLRGFVLRALSGWPSWWGALLVCGLGGAAAQLGIEGSTAVEIALAGVTAVAFAAIWQRDRGAWMAVGAHTAWLFTAGTVIRGGLLDVRFAPTVWGGGDEGLRGSVAGLIATAIAVVAAVAWARRGMAQGAGGI